MLWKKSPILNESLDIVFLTPNIYISEMES
jgi:hypothetical protein